MEAEISRCTDGALTRTSKPSAGLQVCVMRPSRTANPRITKKVHFGQVPLAEAEKACAPKNAMPSNLEV